MALFVDPNKRFDCAPDIDAIPFAGMSRHCLDIRLSETWTLPPVGRGLVVLVLSVQLGFLADSWRDQLSLFEAGHRFIHYALSAIFFFGMYFVLHSFSVLQIFFLKRWSYLRLNRATGKVYVHIPGEDIVADWSQVSGRLHTQWQVVNGSFTPHEVLELTIAREHKRSRYAIVIDTGDDMEQHKGKALWNYLCTFMEDGPKSLPIPRTRDYFYRTGYFICLTPAEAWRECLPWPVTRPDEDETSRKGRIVAAPFKLVFFPVNWLSHVVWWLLCRLFRARPAPLPAGADDGNEGPMVTMDMAARGMRP